MKASKQTQIDNVIDELKRILASSDARYSENDRNRILESIEYLQEYKRLKSDTLLVKFTLSLLKAFLLHKALGMVDEDH